MSEPSIYGAGSAEPGDKEPQMAELYVYPPSDVHPFFGGVTDLKIPPIVIDGDA